METIECVVCHREFTTENPDQVICDYCQKSWQLQEALDQERKNPFYSGNY